MILTISHSQMTFKLCFSIIPKAISIVNATLNLSLPFWPIRGYRSSLPEVHVSTFSLCPFLLELLPLRGEELGVGELGVGGERLAWLQELLQQLGFLCLQAASFFQGLSEFGIQQLPEFPMLSDTTLLRS